MNRSTTVLEFRNKDEKVSSEFPQPEYRATDEEDKLEILRCLSRECLLADTIRRKESTDCQTVHEGDNPGLFRQLTSF
jgi:hypothetical protein